MFLSPRGTLGAFYFPMFLCYLDESGTPELTDHTTHFVLLGLAIPAEYWHKGDAKITRIKANYGLTAAEIHTAYLTRLYPEQEAIVGFDAMDRTTRRLAVKAEREKLIIKTAAEGKSAKLKQLKKNYSHTDDYIHLNHDERQKLLRELADELGSWGYARLFADAIEKKKVPTHVDSFDTAFEQVVSRFHVFLEYRENSWLKSHPQIPALDTFCGLLIEDNNDTRAKRLTNLMRSFHLKGTTWWDSIDRIIETPLFVDSHLTSLVQMADLCAYATRRFFENGETDLFDRIYSRFDKKGTRLVGLRHYTGADRCTCKVCKAHRSPFIKKK